MWVLLPETEVPIPTKKTTPTFFNHPFIMRVNRRKNDKSKGFVKEVMFTFLLWLILSALMILRCVCNEGVLALHLLEATV